MSVSKPGQSRGTYATAEPCVASIGRSQEEPFIHPTNIHRTNRVTVVYVHDALQALKLFEENSLAVSLTPVP